jgi:hypothetical protein
MLYEIYEVYYNQDGTINGITEEPIRIREETVDDLRKTVERLTKCLNNPVIDYDTFKEIEQ